MNIEIGHSEIHGHGVFAVKKIDAEHWQYLYGFWPSRENRYCFDRDGRNWEPYPPFSCLNHSDTPNCEAYETEGVMFIEALRDIEADEELTIDYGFDPGENDAIHGHQR